MNLNYPQFKKECITSFLYFLIFFQLDTLSKSLTLSNTFPKYNDIIKHKSNILSFLMHSHAHENSQKLYDNILHLFRQHDQHSHSLVNYRKLLRVFDTQAQAILEENFRREILEEIWDHVENQNKEERQVIKIAEGFVSAYGILVERMEYVESEKGVLEEKRIVLQHKRSELQEYMNEREDYHIKRVTTLESECKCLQKQIVQIQENYAIFKDDVRFIDAVLIFHDKNRRSQLGTARFDAIQEERRKLLQKQSKSLQFIFYATISGIICELLSMNLFVRHTILPLFCYCISIEVLFIGYIRYKIVVYLIIGMSLSLILDIFYFYLLALQYITQHNEGFFRVKIQQVFNEQMLVYIGLFSILISSLLRLLVSANWMKHVLFNKKHYYFMLWGHKIELNKRVVQNFSSS